MRIAASLALCLALLLAQSCTRHPSMEMPPDGTPPDSLRAKVAITIWDGEAAQDLDATILAVPGKRYRAEFTGPLGIHVGSLLWKDSAWILVMHRDESYLRGSGEYLVLPGVLLPPLRIHDVMGVLWGKRPPQEAGDARVAGTTLEWFREGKRVFRMETRERNPAATWGEGAWILEPPEDYHPFGSPPP